MASDWRLLLDVCECRGLVGAPASRALLRRRQVSGVLATKVFDVSVYRGVDGCSAQCAACLRDGWRGRLIGSVSAKRGVCLLRGMYASDRPGHTDS
jgi:hypothetical protein